MPLISITRLRIRSIRFLPGFALLALRTRNQVLRAPGFTGGSILNDRSWVFWTMTAWDEEASMRRYVTGGAHRVAMPRLVEWCDEASIVHWTQPDAALPSWAEADRRMRANGRPSRLRHPSPDHATLGYRPPRLTGAGPLRPSVSPG
ncbi:DUF3291 domain-containing protein [Methylobacterium soli]|uniref:DUF3291 domain-containing protein n=1 Tax=Methylobacterium soli TaxID=553447 RepID=A0A6L3T3I8_9HYPH|nr:DUF3291 domain-containing protein [Methylobacterium soli]KAB1081389.1 DUF3291 domain-containing protein [Methylobacterium soli]GJE42143.1 hypothetical protein AEGHOMDF_1314 [Methylobacterium soli]